MRQPREDVLALGVESVVETEFDAGDLHDVGLRCRFGVAERKHRRDIPQPDHDLERCIETGRVFAVVAEEHVDGDVGFESGIVVCHGLLLWAGVLRPVHQHGPFARELQSRHVPELDGQSFGIKFQIWESFDGAGIATPLEGNRE